MHYTTLLFDLDHTLFDSDTSERAAFRRALGEAQVEEPSLYLTRYLDINRSLWAAVERGEIQPADVRVTRFERLVSQTGIEADPKAMADTFVAALGDAGELYDGARDVLETLSGEVTLAMVTNGLAEVQRSRIERLDLERYFETIVISGEVGVSKPGTEIFDITFDLLAAPDKNTTLMIGDSLTSDIQGGINYDILTCWYNPHGKTSTLPTDVTHEISRLAQLPWLAARGEVRQHA